ncbi:Tat pathway signal protein [Clostridium sp. chh4-2]|uniref:tripartite tricarboxylate transporter permease n=1 Tax=Clostridium sp. chh4-2 TaxID=2067550 RepID=UPI000CCDB826|nr:tripartite tricarboxylate transporter permease [Clostridium sp. chh4-2]PNV59870.1 Tat pathway signal protein [Clostridium sp. chh4-2]
MEAYLGALMTVLQPSHLLIILVCSLAGIVFGAIPGLSGGLGVSLLLPLTFGMEPTLGFAMLIGMWVGGVSGSFIAATLVGIPGSPASIATCFDAYPMSQKGETVRALSIGILGSFTGTFFSVVIATVLSPVIADLALKLGPWEYFSLCFCAITLVASLSKGSIFKGLMGAFLGIFIATIGMDPVTAQRRFTFGSIWLSAGISMVPLMLGVFAIKQVAVDYAKGQQDMPEVDTKGIKGIGIKIADITSNIVNIIRSFMIGLWIGFLPGMGSGLSNMVAYAQAKSGSKKPEEFGKGCPDGIWASEVSNNASVGGALIPMMALGIPGDSTTALLLSGLMIHGLQPGPLMIGANPQVSYVIFAATLVAAVLVLFMQLFGMRWFPYLLKVPYHYLYGIILVMCFVGGYTSSNTMFNVVMMLVFAGLSILMDMAKIPSSPFILAFILGPKLEEYFRKGVSYGNNGIADFVLRPVSLIFLLVAVVSVAWPYIKDMLNKKKSAAN